MSYYWQEQRRQQLEDAGQIDKEISREEFNFRSNQLDCSETDFSLSCNSIFSDVIAKTVGLDNIRIKDTKLPQFSIVKDEIMAMAAWKKRIGMHGNTAGIDLAMHRVFGDKDWKSLAINLEGTRLK
jgi:hypothetical protein